MQEERKACKQSLLLTLYFTKYNFKMKIHVSNSNCFFQNYTTETNIENRNAKQIYGIAITNHFNHTYTVVV